MAPKKADPKAKAKAAAAKPEAKAAAAKPEAKAKTAVEEKKVEQAKAEEKKVIADAAAEKRKGEEEPGKTPPKKVAKKAEEAKEVVETEKEKDAPADSRPAIKAPVSFDPSDTTLNVLPTLGGKVLMALTEGGMQYLIAGARANTGIKAGRYLYEVKIVEALNPAEATGLGGGRGPKPRQLLRLGFSLSGSELVLGEGQDFACFDSEGYYNSAGKRTSCGDDARFQRGHVVGVLLNVDPGSPNANTLSLFRDGKRIAGPSPLPEALHGKTLFPHVAFRNVTVRTHFGPEPLAALPFKCRLLQGAAQKDVEVISSEPKDGKYEVCLPVAFPDEGTFDWLDQFLAKNPKYTELSNRKLLDWATKSGMKKPPPTGRASNDRPEFNFGLPAMDDLSVRRVVAAVAPVVPRNYLIMEVKENLLETVRTEVLKRFSAPHYKRVAQVVMGEPKEEYKKANQEYLLAQKQKKVDEEWNKRKVEKQRKKEAKAREKKLREMRRQAEERRKKAAAEAKRKSEELREKAAAAKKKAEEEAAAKKKAEEAEKAKSEKAEGDGEEKAEGETAADKDGDAKMEEAKVDAAEEAKDEPMAEKKEEEEKKEDVATEEKKEEEKEEDKKDEEEEEEEEPEEPRPVAELDEEDLKHWFRSKATKDLTAAELSKSFGDFSIPEKAEGFDDIRFEWQKAADSKSYLKKWVVGQKLTAKMDDLKPGKWFTTKWTEWKKTLSELQKKQKEFKAKQAKEKKEEEKTKVVDEGEAADGEKEDEMEVDTVDIFTLEDIGDIGNGEPLYSKFTNDDWALVQLRMEMYLMVRAYKLDVNDEERVGIHESNIVYYYAKYFRKQFKPALWGVKDNKEVIAYVKDAAKIEEDPGVLATEVNDDLEEPTLFVRQAEECRRERERRIDAGDETGRLKFTPQALTGQAVQATPQPSAVGAARPSAFANVGSKPFVAPGATGGIARPAGPAGWQARPATPGSVAGWRPGQPGGAAPRPTGVVQQQKWW